MTITRFWQSSLTILMLGILLWGCVSGASRQATDLLLRDYMSMPDAELQTYYRQVNDTLAQLGRDRRYTSFGVGMATSSVGVGVSQGVSTPSEDQELRDRSNLVRQELRRRGLIE